MGGIIHIAPSCSRWIRSSAINEERLYFKKKRCALVQKSWIRSIKSCVRSIAGCADLNLVCLVARVASLMAQIVTILSGQSVISRVYTSHFGNGMARLEPQPRWSWKKYQVLYPVENPSKVSHTMQWKSLICNTIVFAYTEIYLEWESIIER